MYVERLQLTNFRALESLELRFKPGMNLIVGVNGVGKSSILDALRALLEPVQNRVSDVRGRPEGLADDDITIGSAYVTAEIGVVVDDSNYRYLIHRPREDYTVDTSAGEGTVRNSTVENPSRNEWLGSPPQYTYREDRPLAVFFSAHRSIANERQSPQSSSGSIWQMAFGRALAERSCDLQDYAYWIASTEALIPEFRLGGDEEKAARFESVLKSMRVAVLRFLDTWDSVGITTKEEKGGKTRPCLVLGKKGRLVPAKHLSDGERGMLTLVLDLAYRLANANINSTDPLTEGRAVVLIDELDLHLHPQWQRLVVQRLTETFPNCQFIATTHSPIILSEADVERVTLLSKEDQKVIINPCSSIYGHDTNYILRFIMGTEYRPTRIQALFEKIDQAIDIDDFLNARDILNELRHLIPNDLELVGLDASLGTLEALAE